MSTIFVLEIEVTKYDKVFNFLNSRFSVLVGPTDMIFGVFSEFIVNLLKGIILQFFSKYSKSYNIINAKAWLKLEGSSKNTGRFSAVKLHVTNRIL